MMVAVLCNCILLLLLIYFTMLIRVNMTDLPIFRVLSTAELSFCISQSVGCVVPSASVLCKPFEFAAGDIHKLQLCIVFSFHWTSL